MKKCRLRKEERQRKRRQVEAATGPVADSDYVQTNLRSRDVIGRVNLLE